MFDRLVSLDPRYRWEDMDGVPVFRPVAAWDDKNDLLNRRVDAVNWSNITAGEAIDSTASLLSPHPIRPSTGPTDKTFSVAFSGGRMIDLLNTVVKSSGHLTWDTRADVTKTGRSLVSLIDFGGVAAISTLTDSR